MNARVFTAGPVIGGCSGSSIAQKTVIFRAAMEALNIIDLGRVAHKDGDDGILGAFIALYHTAMQFAVLASIAQFGTAAKRFNR